MSDLSTGYQIALGDVILGTLVHSGKDARIYPLLCSVRNTVDDTATIVKTEFALNQTRKLVSSIAKIVIAIGLTAAVFISLLVPLHNSAMKNEMFTKQAAYSKDGLHEARLREGSENPHSEVILDGKVVVSTDNIIIWKLQWVAKNELEVLYGYDTTGAFHGKKRLEAQFDNAGSVHIAFHYITYAEVMAQDHSLH